MRTEQFAEDLSRAFLWGLASVVALLLIVALA